MFIDKSEPLLVEVLVKVFIDKSEPLLSINTLTNLISISLLVFTMELKGLFQGLWPWHKTDLTRKKPLNGRGSGAALASSLCVHMESS